MFCLRLVIDFCFGDSAYGNGSLSRCREFPSSTYMTGGGGGGGGSRLIGIDECVRKQRKSLYGYLRESTEWILQAALKENVIVEEESLQDYERTRKDEKVNNWKEKALHGAFVQQISDEAREESW